MRIISGTYRGKKLVTLESDKTRPTTDRVKESMFNLIMFDVNDSKVLDLFSGSGSLGIECLSRNAKSVDFNDNNLDAVKVIKKNLQNIKGEYKVYSLEYKDLLRKLENSMYDLIFVDPPYEFNIEGDLLNTIALLNVLKVNGKVIYESNKELYINNDNFEIEKQKKYGITYVSIIRRIS